MHIALDLERRAWSRVLGDITIIGTWLRQESDEPAAPCLVLVRTGEEFNALPCIVPLSAAWIWDDRKGQGDPTMAAQTAMAFAKAMRFDDGNIMRRVRRIAEIVCDHLDQLIAMPPAPPVDDAQVVAEAVMTIDGQQFEATISE